MRPHDQGASMCIYIFFNFTINFLYFRWAIKQESLSISGQWKLSRVENPEWNKQALSWPVDENGEINEDLYWPMEGYFVPYAPPIKKPQSSKTQAGIWEFIKSDTK